MVKALLDTVEIKVVTDVLFIDFAEKLMIFQVTEPVDPSHTLLWTVRVRLWHGLCQFIICFKFDWFNSIGL